jgi:CoA-transferase family III
MPLPRAPQAFSPHRARSHPDPVWAKPRAAAGGLGRQRHQDRRPAGGFRQRTIRRAAPESGFQNVHRNKRAMTLELKDSKGLEVFRQLAKKADVVVETFRPDVDPRQKLSIS